MTAWQRAEDPGSTQPLLTAVVFSGPAVPIAAPCLVVGADVKQRAAAFLHPLSHPRRKCETLRRHPDQRVLCGAMRSRPLQDRSRISFPPRACRENEKRKAQR